MRCILWFFQQASWITRGYAKQNTAIVNGGLNGPLQSIAYISLLGKKKISTPQSLGVKSLVFGQTHLEICGICPKKIGDNHSDPQVAMLCKTILAILREKSSRWCPPGYRLVNKSNYLSIDIDIHICMYACMHAWMACMDGCMYVCIQ